MSVSLQLAQALMYLSGAAATNSTTRRRTLYYGATCPDPQCNTTLYFPSHEPTVECCACGQRHQTAVLSDRRELSQKEEEFQRSLSELRQMYGGKKTAELVKVKGISNYQCKLLSPLLTTHGMDKQDQPRPLKELGPKMGSVFDCGKLASRAFAIEESFLDTAGYGQDKSGALKYLGDTLQQIWDCNNGRKCLVPVHADGDGHCLVHAISRCLVGRELFWHALRTNMQEHLYKHKEEYAALLKDFYEESEWPEIVEEAGPDYQPPDGQSLGLRTVHIFALANVLKRPIVLLDGLSGMQSKGEYSGIFLPLLISSNECSTGGRFNSPIVIAWSNAGYNHFIPLVPIKDRPLPRLPFHLRPKVWGSDESSLDLYTELDTNGSLEMCRGSTLKDTYLQKLVQCMESLFFQRHEVVPSLVADVNQHVYRSAGCVGISPDTVVQATRSAIMDGRLYRCLLCSGISIVPEVWLANGGVLYDIAAHEYDLTDGEKYTFPRFNVTAQYCASTDCFVPVELSCFNCGQMSRRVSGDGKILYQNGDRTLNPAKSSRCGCGYKHFWNGLEYDNLPEVIPLQLSWRGRVVKTEVHWFQYESDPDLNSNAYAVANKVVIDQFPGEFGSEQLVKQVVDQILSATEKKTTLQQVQHTSKQQQQLKQQQHHPGKLQSSEQEWLPVTKTIATGMSSSQSKVLHKEELGASETERMIRKRVEDKLQGRKKTPPPSKDHAPPQSKDQTPPSSPPAKSSLLTERPKPSPPSPTSSKRIRVTVSDGRAANLSLSPTASFSDLQQLIQQELGIPPDQQRLRSGFPPKELRPAVDDPSAPVALSNGERVSVECIGSGTAGVLARSNTALTGDANAQAQSAGPPSSAVSWQSKLDMLDIFDDLQRHPRLFHKGGTCYEEVMKSYGSSIKHGTHIQFQEMSDVVFRYNAQSESLEVCLGLEHIPVGPLTPAQREKARGAAKQSQIDSARASRILLGRETGEGSEGESHGGHWLVNRSTQSTVKAFSGTGHTLGGSGKTAAGNESSDSVEQPLRHQEQPQQLAPEQSLVEALQRIAAVRLKSLREREQQLQTQVRQLNRELVQADSNQDDVDTENAEVSMMETRLLDLSSELKNVRTEIKELMSLS